MKKFLLFLLLIISGSFYQAKSQNLLDTNNKWTYFESEYAWGYRSISLFIDGDTTINQISYKKIMASVDSVATVGNFWAALREDTLTKKVYSISWAYPHEVVIYDFGLAVGDSFLFPLQGSDYYYKLDSITAITLLDGSVRRKFNFNYGILNWIEGIGSEISLNYPITMDPDIGFRLLCFEKSNIQLYFDSSWQDLGNSCYIPFTGINTINKIDVEISPNPASNSFKIKGEQLLSYQLTDLNGKIIQENKITNDDELIPITSVSSGLYFLKVIGKEGIAFKKLIIN